jgi:tripartite-type tricarboxylate transporter receptor subunit TctC
MEEISYKGVGDVITALLANDVHLYSAGYASMKPYVDSGQLVPLAAMGESRLKELPSVPTLRERNIDYVSSFWYGVWAPPTTEKAVVTKISEDIKQVLFSRDLKAALEARALTVIGSSPEVFRNAMEQEMRVKRDIAKAANIQPK